MSPLPRTYDRLMAMGNHGPPEPMTPGGWESYLSRGAVLAQALGHFDAVTPYTADVHVYADRIANAVHAWANAGNAPETHPVVAAIHAAHALAPTDRAVDAAVAAMYALPEWRAIYAPG